MKKLVRESIVNEGYGSGYSYTGGYRGGMSRGLRGGFGGAWNMGGPNTMYTYEIKALNHVLESPPKGIAQMKQDRVIKQGSKISGRPVRSNKYPDDAKQIKGLVQDIVKTDNGDIKFYVIQDEETQTQVKIDPVTAVLIIYEPIRHYYNAAIPIERSKRKRKSNISVSLKEGQIVPESLIV